MNVLAYTAQNHLIEFTECRKADRLHLRVQVQYNRDRPNTRQLPPYKSARQGVVRESAS
jgi:hypothetical protein